MGKSNIDAREEKMGMYLVCFYRNWTASNHLLTCLGHYLIGHLFHVEIAFIRYGSCKALYVTTRMKRGKPKFEERIYEEDPDYRIELFQFKNVDYETERKCELLCEDIILRDEYKMDGEKMVTLALPTFFSSYASFFFRQAVSGSYHQTSEKETPVYCVSLSRLVTDSLNIPTLHAETATDFFQCVKPYLESQPELIPKKASSEKKQERILRSELHDEEYLV